MEPHQHFSSTQAGQALQATSEAIVERLKQAFPATGSEGQPLRAIIDTDDTTEPHSLELRFENTKELRLAYQDLHPAKQVEVVNSLRLTVMHTLGRSEPHTVRREGNDVVYVFGDQSAVEFTNEAYRRDEPLWLPTVRAIHWQQPRLLVGDARQSTEMNLARLGYRRLVHTNATAIYSHYDPAMPLLGYGCAEGCNYLSVLRDGQAPCVVRIPGNPQGSGLVVDLTNLTGEALKAEASQQTVGEWVPRYPAALLEQVFSQFGINLSEANAKRLLNGQKTEVLVTGNGSTGKLYVLNTPEQGPQVVMQDVQQELTLKGSYLGHVFSDKDRQNLLKFGDMGRAVELIDKPTGTKFIGFIGVDKDTNTLTVLRADQIRPKIERMSHLKGVPLNRQQKQRLLEGKAVRLDNMRSSAGALFSAFVRVSAARRALRFDPIASGHPQKQPSNSPPPTASFGSL